MALDGPQGVGHALKCSSRVDVYEDVTIVSRELLLQLSPDV